MIEYSIHITEPAETDLLSIREYISVDLCAPDASDALMDLFETQIASLQKLPKRYPLVDEEPWRSRGIRWFALKHFLVYFLVNDDNYIVYVTGVIYEKRNSKGDIPITDTPL